MSLREQRESERRFRAWVTANRERLLASGIPLAAWSSLRNWQYFAEHEDLTYEQDPSGFSINELTPEQCNVLCELLEEYRNALDVAIFITKLRRQAQTNHYEAKSAKERRHRDPER